MSSVDISIIEHPLAWLFLNVLGDQSGLPIPAYPSLVLAGAISNQGMALSVSSIIGVAVLGCLLADSFWYWLGRRFGAALLNRIGRRSERMEALVANSRKAFLRHGPRLFLVARFVPGASAILTLLAGQLNAPRLQFALFNIIGAAIWAGSAIALGAAFGDTVINASGQAQLTGGVLGGLVIVVLVTLILIAKIRRRSVLSSRVRLQDRAQRPFSNFSRRWISPTITQYSYSRSQRRDQFQRVKDLAQNGLMRPTKPSSALTVRAVSDDEMVAFGVQCWRLH